jgi:G3E family GTPase
MPSSARDLWPSGVDSSGNSRLKLCNSNTTTLQQLHKATLYVKMSSAARVLPVTVLCGFLGAGKTTLLNNILRDNHGMKIALIVNDMGSVNIDAALVKQSNAEYMAGTERVVEMQNGCICCTLREDLLQEVAALAHRGVFDYLVIESSGISEPMPIAETFTFEDLPEAHHHDHHHHHPSAKAKKVMSLMESARLDTMVTVVDCFNFLRNLRSVESVRDRDKDADAADERGIAHLLIDQVEFADVIIMNKSEMLSPEELLSVRATIIALNPSAKLHVTSYSKIDLSCVVNTGLFSMEKAGQHAGWLKELRGEHVPETLEYGISSFVYRARRPFHVGRLHSLLETCFLFNSARPSDEAEAAAALQLRLQAQERLDSSEALAAPLRSKGFIWLSSMHLKVCEWAQAGAIISITPHGPWFADVPLSSWPEEESARAAIKADMIGPHGDRRQELVFIGQVIFMLLFYCAQLC